MPDEDERAEKLAAALADAQRQERKEHEADAARQQQADDALAETLARRTERD